MTETCAACKDITVPWEFCNSINGYLCFDCSVGRSLTNYVPEEDPI